MANVPTVSWDETSPAGTQAMSLGDDRIREIKTQLREVIDVDHDFPSSGQAADVGQHKQVTLQEQADLGTGAVGATILGSQTTGGKGELIYTDEDDNDVQLTNGGKIMFKASENTEKTSLTGNDSLLISDSAASNVQKKVLISTVLKTIYPVGSIYINATSSTNPATLLGFGTWSAFGAGRVMVGLNASDSDFDTAEETGGAKTHTLTTDEIPAHTHTIDAYAGSGAVGEKVSNNHLGTSKTTPGTNSSGGGGAHNNLQPYVVVYMWKRTA